MVQRFDAPPRIETARLLLDGHRDSDFEAMAGLFGDAGTMRHIGGKPLTRKECYRNLLRYRGTWPILGYGKWVIRDRADGRFLGQCGFFRDERGLPPPYGSMPEAGWVVVPPLRGQGIAAEAVAASLRWLDTIAGWAESLCLIDPANDASLKLAHRMGYAVSEGVCADGEEALVLLRRNPGLRDYPQHNVG